MAADKEFTDNELTGEDVEEENVVLVDEDGVEHTFVVLDVVEVDGAEYAILRPEEDGGEDEEEPEAVILKIAQDENGEEILVDIEDDDEWEKVADFWQESEQDDEDSE
jgi:uncharacterized protein YrzB (UPF0473 family)